MDHAKEPTMKNTVQASTAIPHVSRRQMLRRSLGLAGAASLAASGAILGRAAESRKSSSASGLKISVAQWCYEATPEKWTLEKTCQVARELGCQSVELVDPPQYPILKKYGLTCALAQINTNPDPPFVKGFNNPDHWPKIMAATREAIDAAAAFGAPNLICFTGFAAKNPADPASPRLSREAGLANCVAGLKQVVGQAEKKGVTLCLEMLNTRDDSHPMKGHPGYQGDSLSFCMDVIKQVGSPRLKLLFDIYHVQVMEGDVIRHLRQLKDYLGHVHAAGNPGRGELDDQQEINFRPIMRTLKELNYQGYVGLEFIPTRNPYQSLRQAVAVCRG
jgi:hydroxypyruvate isomerase